MNASAWRLPDAPLRASAITSTLIGLALVCALATAARASLALGDRYPLNASVVFAVIMLLSIGFLQRRHPFPRFGPANQITTLRAVIVALVAGLVGETPQPGVAAGAVAASVTVSVLDGVDGWIARRHRISSAFGARFDMEIDSLLILALSVLAWRYGKAGAWVMASGALRYTFVAAGATAPWLRAALPASRRRQAICVIQIAALTLAMVPSVQPPLSALLAAGALIALGDSFLVDTLWLWRHAA